MIALKIIDIKDFTNKLFIGTIFDSFWLSEATITTFTVFHIDGKLQMDFFETDEKNILLENKRSHSLWQETKPYCHSIIRGKRKPINFKIVLQLSHNLINSFIKSSGASVSPESVHGLFLNIQFKNQSLLCTTGTSYSSFHMDKHLEHYWDDKVLEFFHQHEILFETI